MSVNLETPLPDRLVAGRPTALYCAGTGPPDMQLLVDGRPVAAARGMPRFDVPVRRSGFWAVVDAHPVAGPVEIAAALPGGERVVLGRVDVEAVASAMAATAPGGPIAICMGTFDPDPDLFAAQIASIRAQSDTDWVCVISDDHSSPEAYTRLREIVGEDARFSVSRAGSRIGFYRNFERALSLAPAHAPLIALCDQDDVWHPDKLAVLRASLGNAMLVYSDQRLVDACGRVLRDTLWRGRRNNTTNLASMLIANTVTGAASLMRREVVARALPFPDSPGIEFHDHWLALVALASGDLAYVDRPLYDYVQHPRAILGKVASASWAGQRVRRRRPALREWRAAYFLGYVPGVIRARTLLLRCDDRLTPGRRHALERYVAAERSWRALAWLALRPARLLAGHTETLGEESTLALGVLWRRLAGAVARLPRWPERWLLDTRFPDPPRFEQKRLRRWRERV